MIIFLLSIFLILFLTGRAPLRNLICLIGIFGFASLLLIYYDVEFLGWMLIMIYIGAIGVLFLFLIMTTDFRNIENTPSVSSYDYILYVIITLLLLVRLPDLISDTSFLQDELLTLMPGDNFWGLQKWYHLETNTLLFVGLLMFNKYYVFVHLAAWILLIALVAAVGLSSDRWNDVKKLFVPSFMLTYSSEIDSLRAMNLVFPEHGGYSSRHKWVADGYYSFDAFSAMWNRLKNASPEETFGYSKIFHPMSYKKLLPANNPQPFPRGNMELVSIVTPDNIPEIGSKMRGGVVKSIETLRMPFKSEAQQSYKVIIDWDYPIIKPWHLTRTWLKNYIEHPHMLSNLEKETLINLAELRWISPRKAYEWEEWETPEVYTLGAWCFVVFLGLSFFALIYTILIDVFVRKGEPIFVPFEEGSAFGLIEDPQGPTGRFLSWEKIPAKWRTEEHFEFFVSIPIIFFTLWAFYYAYYEPGWLAVLFVAWWVSRTLGSPNWFEEYKRWWTENNLDENLFVVLYREGNYTFEYFAKKFFEIVENYLLSYQEYFLFYSKQNPIFWFLILLICIFWFFLVCTLCSSIFFIGLLLPTTVIMYFYVALKPYYTEFKLRLDLILDVLRQVGEYHDNNKEYFKNNSGSEERLFKQVLYEIKKIFAWVVRPIYLEPYQRTYYCYLGYATWKYKELIEEEEKVYKTDLRWYEPDYEFPVLDFDYFLYNFGPGYSEERWNDSYEIVYQAYLKQCEEYDEETLWAKFRD